MGQDLVLWQAGDQIQVWQDLCIHRGTKLSLGKVREQRIQCPYHGWTYGLDGSCVHIPAHPDQKPPVKAQAKTYRAKVMYDLVWACLDAPANPIPHFPEWSDDSYRKLLCGPYSLHASAPRAIENFLDVGHFPFVHEGILGVPEYPEIQEYEAELTDEGVLSKDVQVYQPDPYGTGQGDYVTYTYRALRPLTAYLEKVSQGPRFTLMLTITPHDEVGCTMWMWMAMNYGFDTPAQELIAWQDRIVSQDIPIVESQRPELLPIDLQAELHLRSDRTAIAYRKWLGELGLSFGTA
jgi:phenylpropionate dioxygenase-like ring-hydroxylating dioxygenase large terminal subunit